MPDINTLISSLLMRAQKVDPAYVDIFTAISKELRRLGIAIDPAPTVPHKTNITLSPPPLNVTVFEYSLTNTNVVLTWEAPSVDILLYEIRLGSIWSSASRILITGTLQAILDPLAEGNTTYLIKALTSDGAYSLAEASVVVNVPDVSGVVISSQQINNQVTLTWTAPTSSFNISHYNVTREGSAYATVSDRFILISEFAAGVYTYGITPVDIAGNEGTLVEITLDVPAPTDFDFEASLESDFSGTITNGAVENDRLIVCIDTAETYEDHFITNSWDSPQEQIDAGYPRWLSPNPTTASYEEVFDFGAIFTNVIVNLSYAFDLISGAFTFGLDTKVSDDNVTYSSSYTTQTFFVTSARYVKIKFDFTGDSDTALLAFYNFLVSLSVKREVDGGEEEVFAADAAGTVVSFNKAFKLVESITVSPLNTATRFISYEFAGGVDPTQFTVKVWNAAGTRVDDDISWKARGVM